MLATARDLSVSKELKALAEKAGSEKVQLFELDFTSEESLAVRFPLLSSAFALLT